MDHREISYGFRLTLCLLSLASIQCGEALERLAPHSRTSGENSGDFEISNPVTLLSLDRNSSGDINHFTVRYTKNTPDLIFELYTFELPKQGSSRQWRRQFRAPAAARGNVDGATETSVTIKTSERPVSGMMDLTYSSPRSWEGLVQEILVTRSSLVIRPSTQPGPFPVGYVGFVDHDLEYCS
ncbi:hypothetical protein PoB_004056900 [Plakobranchus ocellatus]|uniref:Uncharacterized protein n=1 Tax=Plakobranchus ocellatus TaxID=259542 RepID=A0AAV4B5U6_9GAST|nr:hypothetical protein PoB_004056900 [Plakobranchus ocellatus]